jgi:superfamily II DNA/RNA helicase
MAQAQSGSGKTGTFVIGCLQLIDPTQNNVQCLILSSTRELVTGTNEVVKAIGKYLGIKSHLSMGGTQVVQDKKVLSDGCHIVVGTPERIYDLLKRDYLNPTNLKVNHLSTPPTIQSCFSQKCLLGDFKIQKPAFFEHKLIFFLNPQIFFFPPKFL